MGEQKENRESTENNGSHTGSRKEQDQQRSAQQKRTGGDEQNAPAPLSDDEVELLKAYGAGAPAYPLFTACDIQLGLK